MYHACRRNSGLMAAMAVLAAAAAGCAGNGNGQERAAATVAAESTPAETAAPAPQDPNQVGIDNFAFKPVELTVKAGAKVTWVNHDDVPHTATSTAKPRAFDSGTLDTDGTFSHVFNQPGTYEYFCAVHPHMKGRIVVK